MSKATKRFMIYGIIFCLIAVLFVLLYYFQVVQHLNLMLTSVYVAYFCGLGFIFNSAYNHKHFHKASAIISGIFGAVLFLASIVLLIIGLTNGQIQF